MKNLLKVALVMTAFVFAAGCAKKQPAPAPQPVMTDTAMTQPAPTKHRRHHKDKLGKTYYKKDTKK
jgi:hypothetical protein